MKVKLEFANIDISYERIELILGLLIRYALFLFYYLLSLRKRTHTKKTYSHLRIKFLTIHCRIHRKTFSAWQNLL